MRDLRSLRLAVVFVFCGFLVTVHFSHAQVSADEQGVRAVLPQFKKGIDSGDRALGAKLAVPGTFGTQFVTLYTMLVDVYQKYKNSIPMEVGHVKILKDGRAKAETYLNPGRDLFVFTLMKDNGQWKFSHHEGILFPIFDFPRVPYSKVLQIPEERRGFMISERDLAFRCIVYREIEKLRGTAQARDFFRDGPGFKTAMDAWLPFLEGAGQFATFLAVLESNYYGSTCTVTKASEQEAAVQFKPLRDLEVLKISIHDPKFSPEEYQALYRHIMKSRADACGLEIKVSFYDTECVVHIRKK